MANEMSYKNYVGSIECSEEDGCLHGKILFIDDLITFEGDTVPGIRAAFENAVDDYLAYCQKSGKPANKPYSGVFQVRIGADLHKSATHAAARQRMKLNEFIKKAVVQAVSMAEGLHINHHHDHEVTVKVRAESNEIISVIASAAADSPPPTWQPVPSQVRH